MNTVLHTLLEKHDVGLVIVAALVCALSSFAGITLLGHARRARRRMRIVWSGVSAVAVGFGIWSTHFVGMLAYMPGITTGYDIGRTVLSLFIAVCIVGSGLLLAAVSTRRADAALGGAVVGLGISAMHYVGMSALLVGGAVQWDATVVAASVLIGMTLGAGSLYVAAGVPTTAARRLVAVGLVTLAVVGMHFTGMGALDLSNCFAVVDAGDATPAWLGAVVATASILILLTALGAILLDLREQQRGEAERERMQALADAAVEGLLMARHGRVATANRSLTTLVGGGSLDGAALADLFSAGVIADLQQNPDTPVETELLAPEGRRIPVELILRRVSYGGRPHEAIAVRDLTARNQAEQRIRFLAHNDPLTGLSNRASFGRRVDDEVALARRYGQHFALLYLDLDRFKEANDLFGHPAGDRLLRRVARRLEQAAGAAGLCARLGGDEFAVLMPDIAGPGAASDLAEAIIEGLAADNHQHHGEPAIACSIGIALFPDNAGTAEELLSHADTALYRAKQDGRGTFRFYQAEMGAQVRERRLLEHDLRGAQGRGEMKLVYQPQVDLESGEVTGFEALARWTHPLRGAVSPSIFVPIAEESGIILQFGEWVLRTAAREAAGWSAPLEVAVNVSTIQLHAPGFAELVADVLLETGLAPHRLEIEITESALVRDMPRAVETLQDIRALGVRIAMDDFGTGYSSLANLNAFPFSRIKVDQSFIRTVLSSEQSAAIVRAVLGLGAGLHIPVVAEGVERPEELEFLRAESCQRVQGFLVSGPMDIESFADVTGGRTSRLIEGRSAPSRRAVN